MVKFTSVAYFILQHPYCRRFLILLERIKLPNSQRQKMSAVGVLVLLVSSLLGSLVWSSVSINFAVKSAVKPRPFVSFDLYDAQEYCGEQVVERMGSKLLRFYVDERSSRLDLGEGIYRVYLQADVGTLYQYDELQVHCFVDRWDAEMDYYREFNPSVKAALSTDIKFFSK